MSRATLRTLVLVLVCMSAVSIDAGAQDRDESSRARRFANPSELAFVENRGQWPGEMRYFGRAIGVLVRVEPNAIALRLPGREPDQWVVVRLSFDGARENAEIVGEQRLPGRRSFFLGNDQGCWQADVPAFAQVRWRGLYEGVDLVARLLPGALKYDLELAPGADLSKVRIRLEGIDDLEAGGIEHLIGETWQVAPDGSRIPRTARLVPGACRIVGVEVDGFRPELATVIDPVLVWATYLGGANYNPSPGDVAFGLAIHGPSGDVYAVGQTEGANFPQTPGAYQQNPGVGADCFVARLRALDGALVYSSVLGGSHNQERCLAVDVDSAGRATVVGFTFSADFPVTPGALDKLKNSQSPGFALRLSSAGDALEYSTFIEGTHSTSGVSFPSVRVLESGSAVLGGTTTAVDLPFPPGSADPLAQSQEGFVLQLNPTGSTVEWGTYLGGSSVKDMHGSEVADDGTVLACGRSVSADFPVTSGAYDTTPPASFSRAFVTRLDANGSAILWSTFFGGSVHAASGDSAEYIAVMPSGDVVFAGSTDSVDFPATPGAFQTQLFTSWNGFAARLDASGSTLGFATLVTSPAQSWIEGLAVDASGVVTLLGRLGVAFPTTSGAWAEVAPGGGDMVIARLHPSGQRLLYSTFFGGTSQDVPDDLARGPDGRVAVSGKTFGVGFPVTPGAAGETYAGGQTDATVALLELSPLGTASFGWSTPACHGPLEFQATRRPVASSELGLWCSGAAPHARGWVLAGFPSSVPHVVFGASVWIDFSQALVRVPLLCNEDGFAETRIVLPPASAGLEFALQCVFFANDGCGSAGTLAASPALRVRVP